MKLLLVFFAFIELANAQTSHRESEYQSIQKLVETVRELSSANVFCNRSTACKAIPTGSKGCGGPSGYVVVSLNNHNYKEISYLAERTVIRENNFNSRYPREGDCEYIQRPETKCVNHRCEEVELNEEE